MGTKQTMPILKYESSWLLPLSKISDNCKNSLIKNGAPEKTFKFPLEIYKDSRKNLMK